MNKYYQVEISGNVEQLNSLQLKAMNEFNCDGVEEFSIDEPTVDSILGERAYSGGDIPVSVMNEVEQTTKSTYDVSYKFYFFEGEYEANANEFEKYVLSEYPELKICKEHKDYEDWNAKWREHYEPLKVSDKLTIVPEWDKDEFPSESSVYIYPGMGFGTGSHETTFLCLKLYEELLEQGNRPSNVLDFGCGSGILGVTTIKRSNSIVDFCDIDKNALENTLQNLTLNFNENELQGHALVIRDRFKPEKEYDLVFANILEHILKLEKDAILANLKVNGHLILSGLLNDQVKGICEFYEAEGLKILKIESKGDWSAILLQRN